MSIIQEVGTDYFSSRFQGCIFLGPNGNPHYVESIARASSQRVNCREVLSVKDSRQALVPFEFFQTFKFLTVPELGWRAAEKGRVLVRLQRNNSSYTRGVTIKNVFRSYAPHTEYMFNMGKLNRQLVDATDYLVKLVTEPGHMSMTEGVKALNRGNIMSFTVNAKVAVVPENNSLYNIFCNADHVANVSPEGQVTMLAGCEDFDPETLQ